MVLRTTSTVLLLPLILGCSTADGLDTGSGGTGGPPDPPEPTPDVDGEACGPATFGWRTECEVYGTISYQNPLDLDDYIEIEPGYAIVKSAPPARLHGTPLGKTGLRKEFGVTIAAFKKPGGEWHNADADTVLTEGDTILIVGPTRKAEGFAQLR